MISFEDALAIVKPLKENVNTCIEYENGYTFGSTEDADSFGGWGHSPVVILKDSGRAVDMVTFIESGTGKELRPLWQFGTTLP